MKKHYITSNVNDRNATAAGYDHDETDRINRAMRAAGYGYQGLSREGYICFADMMCEPIYFVNWAAARDFIDGLAEKAASTESGEESAPAFTIAHNDEFNGTEVSFPGKPSEEVRSALKALGFRWHGQRRVWYGYTDEETARAAIDGKPAEKKATAKLAAKKAEQVNKFGVKVGDIFYTSWGWEQTNNDFFQVIALCGESSVRVREVYLPLIECTDVSGMSEDRVFQVKRDELLPAADHSVFIKDQEKGDVKRLKSYADDGKSNPQFFLTSYADAHLVSGDTIKVYESWYA